MVTAVATFPETGEMALMTGLITGGGEGGVTVKFTPLLEMPLTITTRGPEVAPAGTAATICELLQLTIETAGVPLKRTELVPLEEPKFEPAMVTWVSITPDKGATELMTGLAGGGGTVTVKVTPLLVSPFTVTVSGPVVAPVGTVARICESLQLTIEAAGAPLNRTLLVPWVAPK
jgi:hypothetical protein